MSDWASGYVTDIGYTFGYYAEINPLRVHLAFGHAGLVSPRFDEACELGFGQGISVNIHAAASTCQWSGTDFNPSHAGFAREMAAASTAGARLYDQSFLDFCRRDDLPDFDYIALHGIWSWVSDENRTIIVDFIRRKLKIGGVLYISYNTQPGWAAAAPLRDLMTQHAEVLSAPGQGIVERIEKTIDFVERLMATNPMYAQSNKGIINTIKQIKNLDKNYVAHEYFNRDWLPMSFARMSEFLSEAKLSFACSANMLESVDALHLTAEQSAFLAAIPDATFRQTTRDFMVNQQFRRDYWVRGARKLNAVEQIERLRQLRFVLVRPRGDVSLTIKSNLGECAMQENVYAPILDVLADHKPQSLGQIERQLANQGITFDQIRQAVLVLTGSGALCPACEDGAADTTRQTSAKLNRFIGTKARGSADIQYVACPLTGGGINLGRFQQLFLLAHGQMMNHASEYARFVWDILSAQGQRIVKDGKTLATMEDNITEITAQAEYFLTKTLPILRGLGLLPDPMMAPHIDDSTAQL